MRKRRKLVFWTIVAVALLLLTLSALDVRLRVVSYTVSDARIVTPVRIAFLSDLHSSRYGKDQKNLLDAIDAQQPDLVLLGGDIFHNGANNDNTVTTLTCLSERYPCYFVSGNHENWAENSEELFDIVRSLGIPILDSECETLTFGQTTINLCGIADPYFGPEELETLYPEMSQKELREFDIARTEALYTEQLQITRDAVTTDDYTLLLVHRPEWIELYAQYGFDLALCGHAHGGQVRIPGLVNGLFAPGERFFPKYAGGEYQVENTTMIVSRGLSRRLKIIPRIYNRPELVIVDLTPIQDA